MRERMGRRARLGLGLEILAVAIGLGATLALCVSGRGQEKPHGYEDSSPIDDENPGDDPFAVSDCDKIPEFQDEETQYCLYDSPEHYPSMGCFGGDVPPWN